MFAHSIFIAILGKTFAFSRKDSEAPRPGVNVLSPAYEAGRGGVALLRWTSHPNHLELR